ncbi:MAG: hypothetical protein M1818_006127 [Claussenomyces sp. TS43310]|nr:MAG: hypothetical protein M1818_006127 [Claussenomyces sp. TS43310]
MAANIVESIVSENSYRLMKVLRIFADIPRARVYEKLGLVYHISRQWSVERYAQHETFIALSFIRESNLAILALDLKSLCSPASAAAHAQYKTARPNVLLGPGGSILVGETTYEQSCPIIAPSAVVDLNANPKAREDAQSNGKEPEYAAIIPSSLTASEIKY